MTQATVPAGGSIGSPGTGDTTLPSESRIDGFIDPHHGFIRGATDARELPVDEATAPRPREAS